MDRRDFLRLGSAAFTTATFFPQLSFAGTLPHGWLNGFKDNQGRYGVAYIDQKLQAEVLFHTPLRLHGIYKHPTRDLIVAPARRPDTELYVFDVTTKSIKVITADEGRHFYGHGQFNQDGTLYFTTENAYDEERGMVGVYDVTQGFKRIAEWSSGGIGPHQMRLYKNRLIIANGGILTHPDTGRATLNMDDMAPNLTYIDITTGQITQQFSLSEDLQHLSIRHIDVDDNGIVYMGLQDQVKNRRDLPLVWKTNGDTLDMMDEPVEGWEIFNGYIGSVSTNTHGLCVASPRGGCAHIWDQTGTTYIKQKDVCGVSKNADGSFILTSGEGIVRDLDGQNQRHALHFDNHCQAV
ncbi:MAG: DUF1513 domain-containing protein [Methylocystaceae bacterium]|nr:DUF1513 domain-containing protein [Methylocystaceae bacterium]